MQEAVHAVGIETLRAVAEDRPGGAHEASLEMLMARVATASAELQDVYELRKRLGQDHLHLESATWRAGLLAALEARPTANWRRSLRATLASRRASLAESTAAADACRRALGAAPTAGPCTADAPLSAARVRARRNEAAALGREVRERRAALGDMRDRLRREWKRLGAFPPPESARSPLERAALGEGGDFGDVSDASMRDARCALGRWRGAADARRPAASLARRRSGRGARATRTRPPFLRLLGVGGPLLDFCEGAGVARVEATCRAARCPILTEGWLSAPDAAARRVLERLAPRKFDAAARGRREGSAKPRIPYARVLHDYTSCARVDLLVPAAAVARARGPPRVACAAVAAGALRATRFRAVASTALAVRARHAPNRALLPTAGPAWWSLRRVDGAFPVDRGHLLRLLAGKRDDHRVRAEFEVAFYSHAVAVPLAARSLAPVFDRARAAAPAWPGTLVLTRADDGAPATSFRGDAAPHVLGHAFLAAPRAATRYRLVASEDADDSGEDDAAASDGSASDDSSDEDASA